MTPWFDSWEDGCWLLVPDDVVGLLGDEDAADAWFDDPDNGHPPIVGVDTHDPLTVEQALVIADYYDGSEFDGEPAGVLAALIALRDHVKAGQ